MSGHQISMRMNMKLEATETRLRIDNLSP